MGYVRLYQQQYGPPPKTVMGKSIAHSQQDIPDQTQSRQAMLDFQHDAVSHPIRLEDSTIASGIRFSELHTQYIT